MNRHTGAAFRLLLSTTLLLVTVLGGTLGAAAQTPDQFRTTGVPGAAQPASTLAGGTLRFPIAGEPTTLDPAQFDWDTATNIDMQVFEGLTQYDQDLNAIPAIASTWSTTNARNWTFSLRNDVHFHNGRTVTADDFVYAWTRAKAAGGTYASFFDDISAWAAPNAATLAVTLTAPCANFPLRLALPLFAVIPSEAAATIGTHPVGAGPFEFVSWTAGGKIVLQKYAGYYGTPAHLAGIEYKFTEDAAQWAAFQAGDLDVTSIPLAQWSAIKSNPNVITSTLMFLRAYGFDMLALSDVRVRRAFQYAIDLAAIVFDPAVAPYDPYLPAHGVVTPGKGSYDSSDILIPYDPTGALTLLAAAGWTDTNGDGILDDGAGANLSIVMQDSTNPSTHAAAVRIADNLANIGGTGVGASVTMNTAWSAATVRNAGWGSDYPGPENDLAPYDSGGLYADRFNYSSDTFHNLMNTAQATLNESARNAAFHAAESQLVLTDAAVLPVFYSTTQYLKKGNVHDLRLSGLGYQAIPLKYVWLVSSTVYMPLMQR